MKHSNLRVLSIYTTEAAVAAKSAMMDNSNAIHVKDIIHVDVSVIAWFGVPQSSRF